MNDSVLTQVLTGIAQQQRDFHEANQKAQQRTLDLVGEIKDDMAEVRTDFALVKREVDEMKVWRDRHVDPALNQFRDGVSQAKGGLKGLKLVAALGLAGAGGGAMTKFMTTIIAPFIR